MEIGNAKAIKTIKSKSRFLCLTVNHLKPEEVKPKHKNKKRLGKKISKDEKKILKLQKTAPKA